MVRKEQMLKRNPECSRKNEIHEGSLLPSWISAEYNLTVLFRNEKRKNMADRMTTRMVKCAAVLDEKSCIGWQMAVPKEGLVKLHLFGTEEISESDLEWIAEKAGRKEDAEEEEIETPETMQEKDYQKLYEMILPVAETTGEKSIGFLSEERKIAEDDRWPGCFSDQFGELIRALRKDGGIFRSVIGAASREEQESCRKNVLRTFNVRGIDPADYIGKPVRGKFLFLLSREPSMQLRSVLEEMVPGGKLKYIGKMKLKAVKSVWECPLESTHVYPDFAVRILLLEPEPEKTMIGIRTCEEKEKDHPYTHQNPSVDRSVSIGYGVSTAGIRKKICIGDIDLKRHYQIVGQTGTGKSTLLAGMILDAVEKGYGMTFFDPHGSTIDLILRCVPEKFAERIRVVRVGDAENPVPMNIWDSDDWRKEERNISDLCELFRDIFDPNQQGFVGPRYERWLSTFAKASIAFLGKRASLESIAVLSQSQENMLKLSKAIVSREPALVEIIKEEYGKDKSNDFQNMLGWFLCKFQRLTSVEQLRKTLGAGANALNFREEIDEDTVTLIDLAVPEIGTDAARILGTLTLMKLWNAALQRKHREKTHIVFLDEAALFQTNPMPRMLAEARKFGLSMVLSHQHTGQLTQEIRDALEANSANFSAFRLSPRDAYGESIRFNVNGMEKTLARQDAYKALTTLSVDGVQTDPFTLYVEKPEPVKYSDRVAGRIEETSVDIMVRPYRSRKAITPEEIQEKLNQAASIFDHMKKCSEAAVI